MTTYLVMWEAEIDADNPVEAAEMARAALRSDDPEVSLFVVLDEHGQSTVVGREGVVEQEPEPGQ